MIRRQSVFIAICSIFLFHSGSLSSQGISISENGNTNPHPSALVDMQSTEQGLLVPRMSMSDRTAIDSPATGLFVYQTNEETGFYFFNGVEWKPINDVKGKFEEDFIIGQDDPNVTEHIVPNSNFETYLYDTSGIIVDDGGLNGNYGDNRNGTIYILGPDFFGDQIGLQLKINSLKLHESDTLIISLGVGGNKYQTLKWTNEIDSVLLPFAVDLAFIKFKSDSSNNDEGFEIRFDWLYLKEQPDAGSDKHVGWFFEPTQAAMRGGIDFANAWRNDSLGRASFSYGQNLKVTGEESVAFGENNIVRGAFSGVVGKNNLIEEFGSFAYGAGNEITGRNTFAGGIGSSASGNNAVALGRSEANGQYAVALGESIAEGQYSFSVGDNNIADGTSSIALGENNWAEGENSFVTGYENRARSGYETVFGLYNFHMAPFSETGWNENDPLFVVGNGASNAPHNALTILKNGNIGFGTHNPDFPLHIQSEMGLGNVVVAEFENIATNQTSIQLNTMSDSPFQISYDSEAQRVHFLKQQSALTLDWSSDVNGRVGIGISSPESKLHINGRLEVDDEIRADDSGGLAFQTDEGFTRMKIMDNGFIGVGTQNPTSLLHVNGRLEVNDLIMASDAGGLALQTDDGITRFQIADNGNIGIGTTSPGSALHVNGRLEVDDFIIADDAGGLALQTDEGLTRLQITDNGDIGIGTTTPTSALHVNGRLEVNDHIRADDAGGLALQTDEGLTRLQITDNGDIGIGTTTPTSALHVNGRLEVNDHIRADDSGGLGFQTDEGLTRLQISDNGNIGIGTTAPGSALHVNGRLEVDDFIIADDSGGLALQTDEGVTRLQIIDDGRVGIGITSPDAQLAVSAQGTNDAMRVRVTSGTKFRIFNSGNVRIGQNSGSTSAQLNINSLSGVPPLRVQHDGTSRFMVHTNGGASIGSSIAPETNGLRVSGSYAAKSGGGSWTATSDIRLKDVHENYTDGLNEILKIRPVRYSYNQDSGYDTSEIHVGVVAQELQKIAPYMTGSFEQSGEEYLTVDNSAMIYMLVNAVKEQQKMIEELQRKLGE